VTDGNAELIRRALSGDHAAFADIVAAHDADMRRLCFVMSGDADLADEAVQRAWERVWQRLAALRDPGRLRSWLLTIAANELRQVLRNRRRRSLAESRIEAVAAPAAAEAAIAHVDLDRALKRLSVDDRELLALHYVVDVDIAELAARLRLSPEGVRSRLKRTRDRLKAELSRD
jgi:RNA polymerase sigma-70 factor (ECF subfamily)